MAKFQYYQDKRGEWRWRLRANNGEIVANSGEGYQTKAGCLKAIKRIRESAPDAEVRIYSGEKEYVVHSEKPDTKTTPVVTENNSAEKPEKSERSKRGWWYGIAALALIVLLVWYFRPSGGEEQTPPSQTELKQETQYAETGQISKPDTATEIVTRDTVKAIVQEKVVPVEEKEKQVEPDPSKETIPAQVFSIQPGDNLWTIAKKQYENPFLWSLIFDKNQQQVSNPDFITPGMNLEIPSLEGTPGNLTQNDSDKIAHSFLTAYQYFNSGGAVGSSKYLMRAQKYNKKSLKKLSEMDISNK